MNRTEKHLKKLINDIADPSPDLQCPQFEKGVSETRKGWTFSLKPRKILSTKYITGFACLMFAIISLPVLARIPFVTERMQNLSHEETLRLADMVNQQNTEADLFSRPLTDEERTRMSSLREEYINGNFPLENITIISDQKATDDVFYYNSDTGMFMLPDDRSLTDEELKQYIDFYFKRDYSLQTHQPANNLSVEKTKDAPLTTDYAIPEQHKKIITAWGSAFGLHNINPRDIKIQEVVHFDDQADNYIYTCQDMYRTFSFTLQDDSFIVASADVESEKTKNTKADTLSGKIDSLSPLTKSETYLSIKKDLEKIINDEEYMLTSAWYLCATDPESCLVDPVYSYMFAADNDTTCWLVSYKYGDAYPYRIWKTTTTWYFENLERGKKINESKGITNEVISLDLETGQPASFSSN